MISIAIQKKLQGAGGKMLLDVVFEVPATTLVALTGHSGAGKTSILKMVAGLMTPDKGKITLHDQCWFDSQRGINRLPQKRSIGFVFQQYALFPNMSVLENLQYALQSRQDYPMIEETLSMMGIRDLQRQYPARLSGGQQQRVALARAIVRKPQLLLLDEPFAALDSAMRHQLQHDLLRLHERYHTTTLIVSHDTAEVARMADQVIVLDNGHIARRGAPEQVLPVMPANFLEGKVIAIDHASQTLTLSIPHTLSKITLPHAELANIRQGDYLRIPINTGNQRESG